MTDTVTFHFQLFAKVKTLNQLITILLNLFFFVRRARGESVEPQFASKFLPKNHS